MSGTSKDIISNVDCSDIEELLLNDGWVAESFNLINKDELDVYFPVSQSPGVSSHINQQPSSTQFHEFALMFDIEANQTFNYAQQQPQNYPFPVENQVPETSLNSSSSQTPFSVEFQDSSVFGQVLPSNQNLSPTKNVSPCLPTFDQLQLNSPLEYTHIDPWQNTNQMNQLNSPALQYTNVDQLHPNRIIRHNSLPTSNQPFNFYQQPRTYYSDKYYSSTSTTYNPVNPVNPMNAVNPVNVPITKRGRPQGSKTTTMRNQSVPNIDLLKMTHAELEEYSQKHEEAKEEIKRKKQNKASADYMQRQFDRIHGLEALVNLYKEEGQQKDDQIKDILKFNDDLRRQVENTRRCVSQPNMISNYDCGSGRFSYGSML